LFLAIAYHLSGNPFTPQAICFAYGLLGGRRRHGERE
jgi:hypothetical protein